MKVLSRLIPKKKKKESKQETPVLLKNINTNFSALETANTSTDNTEGTQKYHSSLPDIYQIDLMKELSLYTQMIGNETALYKNVKKLEHDYKKQMKTDSHSRSIKGNSSNTTTNK